MPDRLPGWFAVGAMLMLFGGGACCPVFGGETLADPTRPALMDAGQAVREGQELRKWRLTSTITGPNRRVAVINNRVVRIGESIGGAVLVEVVPGSAVLVHGGRRLHLKLNAKTVKHSVKTAP